MLGQCTDALKNKLEATDGYETTEDADDVTESLKCIKNIAHEFEGDKHPQGSLCNAHLAFYLMKQQ